MDRKNKLRLPTCYKKLQKDTIIIKNERYVQDGKYITSAGVFAWIDMVLYLAGKIAGDLVQLLDSET